MAHKVETMAYANEVPWHGLGVPVSDDMTPEQMLKAAKLDWTVSKRALWHYDRPDTDVDEADEDAEVEFMQAPEQYALVRDSDNSFLSTVGRIYKPVQNHEAFEFFADFVKQGHMKMETAGSLWGGRYVFGLARVGADFAIGSGRKKDEIHSYLLLMSPHEGGKTMVIQYTPVRVVCWNTLNFALGRGLKGGAGALRINHRNWFAGRVRKQAQEAMGLAVQQAEEFKEAADVLAKAKAKPEDVEDFFWQVLKLDRVEFEEKVKAAAKAKGEKKPQEPRSLKLFRHALEYAPGADLVTARGTWWGAVNAVTRVYDHEYGQSDRGTALKTAWFGHTAERKRRAIDLALEAAK